MPGKNAVRGRQIVQKIQEKFREKGKREDEVCTELVRLIILRMH